MTSLPVCRWREVHGNLGFLCNSEQFAFPPNVVTERNCRQCGSPDHPPLATRPNPLPCVHLGRPHRAGGGDSLNLLESASQLFDCALHDVCIAGTTGRQRPLGKRQCAACADYLPRDLFGADSATMLKRAEEFLSTVPAYSDGDYSGRGVVIAGGGDRFFPSLYITIRALRHVGCTLPIEVWYLGRNREMPKTRQKLLTPYSVDCIDADEFGIRHGVEGLGGWELKVFATLYSRFEEVLYLDADCYPCRNPEFLFELADYQACGSIFWADTMAQDSRLNWPAFGVADPRFLGSIESGQFILNKRSCWRALNLAWYYNKNSQYYYRYCYGDKHTFEAAWASCQQPFVMWQPQGRWVDVAYIHGGPDQEPLFIHRVRDKFRLESQKYVTTQHRPLPGYYTTLPMESLCWTWLAEIAALLRKQAPTRGDIEYVPAPTKRRTGRPRIALATMFTREISALGALTSEILKNYAKRHGYDVAIARDTLDASRHPAWSKLLLIEELFHKQPELDWLFWIDADAVIMDRSQRLEDFLDENADFIVAEDVPWSGSSMNTGVFFLRNCPATLQFLRLAHSKLEYLKHTNWEQPAMAEASRECAGTVRTHIVSRDLFNVFFHERQAGDFIVHVAGGKNAFKLAAIRHLIASTRFKNK